MPFKVLVVPDKFKGTLTAQGAAEAIVEGWHQVRPQDAVESLPMSDGGDGFGEVLGQLLGGKKRVVSTVDAAHRPLQAHWWWVPNRREAIIESAQAVGLALLPPQRYHPFGLDTFGLGALMKAAAESGARRCVVGIGGSATNDGGFGLAKALGWQFTNSSGGLIDEWLGLDTLAHLRPPKRRRWFRELRVAVDVRNPLLGPKGCSRIYGPQKGLKPEDFPAAESCLRRLALAVKRNLGLDAARKPGAGAAGGLGFGLHCFLGARLEPGFELFAHYAQLADRLKNADLVVTGEGALDASTLMGKGVGELARLCQRRRVPCLGLAGIVADKPELERRFKKVYCLAPDLTTPAQARARPTRWLSRAAAQAANELTESF
jgi:glycerate kinase